MFLHHCNHHCGISQMYTVYTYIKCYSPFLWQEIPYRDLQGAVFPSCPIHPLKVRTWPEAGPFNESSQEKQGLHMAGQTLFGLRTRATRSFPAGSRQIRSTLVALDILITTASPPRNSKARSPKHRSDPKEKCP